MASEEGRRQVVLVVDDDPNARAIHTEWLAHAGYETMEADSGDVGFRLALAARPALILIDLEMPRVDGWKLLEWLRGEAGTSDLILVALTIVGRGEDRRDPVRRGFDEHWVKPIPAAALLAGIDRLIGPPMRGSSV